MRKTALITGAGSGVGRATAIALAQEGWSVALVGTRVEVLQQTAAESAFAGKALVVGCDLAQPAEIETMAARVTAEFTELDLLVNAAGTNTPNRSLEVLTFEKYREMVETNLTGPYLCIQAFLPQMRRRGSGTIINIVSDAAKQASAKAGPGYVVSKFGLAGLTQSINAEERGHGIRACAIFPGDIDTPLLQKRPAPPDAAARQKMLQPEDVAACVLMVANLPARAVVEEILIRPR